MKLCMFSPKGENLERGWPGRVEGDRVIQLAAQTLQSFFTGGGNAREHAEFPLDEVELRPPVLHPPSVRDFYAFEQHVKTARGLRGLEMVPEWYEIPAFYFSNPAAIYGPEDEIPYPDGSQELDYELELAAVIGADGEIAGFTVMNDWSARDLQRPEMKIGLGPAKGKDFATSIGPVLVTPDELGRPLAGDGRACERRRALAGLERDDAPLVGRDRGARRSQHASPSGRHPRLGHRRHRLHPRARRRPLASARRRRRAGDRGDRRAAQPGCERLVGSERVEIPADPERERDC